MDIKELANKMVIWLVPLFPYLGEISKGFLSKIGEDIWDRTQSLWKLLTNRMKNTKDYDILVSQIIKDPSAIENSEYLRKMLVKKLKNDKKFYRKATKIVSKLNASTNTKQEIVIKTSELSGGVVQAANNVCDQKILIEDSKVAKRVKQILRI